MLQQGFTGPLTYRGISQQVGNRVRDHQAAQAEPHPLAAAQRVATLVPHGLGEQGPVEWSFSGPDQTCYTAQIVGAQSAISCYYPSPVPLTVSITDGTATLTAEIKLTGS